MDGKMSRSKQSINEDISGKIAEIADKLLGPVEKIYEYFTNSKPVADFDIKIEQEINRLKTKTDPSLVKRLEQYAAWGKNNPGKQSFLVGAISVISTLAGGLAAGIVITLLVSIINELISNPKFSRALAIGSRDAILGILIRIINDLRKKNMKEETGPKFTGYWKGTDKRPPRKHMVGSMEEEANGVDTISLDVPLLLRIMEYAREDAKNDQDLHHVASKMTELSKNRSLTMSDYDSIVSTPRNIREQARRRIALAQIALLENRLDLAEYHIKKIKKIFENKLESADRSGGWIDTSKDNIIYPLKGRLHKDVAEEHGIKMSGFEDYLPAFDQGWVRFYFSANSLELSGYFEDLKKSYILWGQTARNKIRNMGAVYMDIYTPGKEDTDEYKIFSSPEDFKKLVNLMQGNLNEVVKDSDKEITHYGNWTIEASLGPVRMPKITGNTAMFVAKAMHKNSDRILFGKGKNQNEATEDAIAQINGNIENVRRSSNPDDFKAFNVDLNVDFTKNYLDPKSGNYFKLDKDDAGQPVLIMASREYFANFGKDMEELGFRKATSRTSSLPGNPTPAYGLSITRDLVKDLGLIPNMRYTLHDIGQDSDGNEMFSLKGDIRTTGPNDKYRMNAPGLTLGASNKQTIQPSLSEAKKKITAKDDPCWKGYHMVGTKKKNSREVPNCVPGKKGT